LNQFARQADIVLLYPYSQVKQKAVNVVVGEYPMMKALELLLQGSGLVGSLTDKGVIKISIETENEDGSSGMTKSKKDGMTLAAALLSLFSVSDNAPAEERPQAVKGIEEIVVTAQRRSENLQDVPIAISAFTENFLVETGVGNTMDLAMVTPGLTYGTQIQGAVPFIRGVGNPGTLPGQDATVATYVDDVYYSASNGSIMAFNNIDRVEVLKGPQGTLFGRNATGGLIHVVTKTPSQETSGKMEVSYSKFDTVGMSFYGTTGIADNIAADLAIYYSDQREGWGKNIETGKDVNLAEVAMLRNKWHITLGDNTELTLGADYTESETSIGAGSQLYPGSLGADGLIVFSHLTAPPQLGGAGMSPEQAAPIAAEAATKHEGSYWDINSSVDPFAKLEAWGASAKVVHQMEDIEFVSITAYRDFKNTYYFSQEHTPFPMLLDAWMPEYTKAWTQELRIAGSRGNVDWIAGMFFLDERSGLDYQKVEGLFLNPLTHIYINTVQKTVSWSVFAQGTYAMTDKTRLTAGLRYTDDERELRGSTTAHIGDILAAGVEYNPEESWDEVTWRLSVDHQLNEDAMLYASYNRGFKSGVFNTVVANPVAGADPAVDPETLDAYEVGFKADFFNSRARLNAAVFYYKYENLQATVTRPGGAMLINAAEAEIQGGELEVSVAATSSLRLHAGISLLDAEYDSFPEGQTFVPTGVGGNTTVPGDLSGNKVIRSPDYTVNIGLVHDAETSVGSFNTSINYFYNDGFFWEPENRITQDSYGLVNGQITWNPPGEPFYLQIYGNNLTNEEYAMFGLSGETGDVISAAAPRTYGLKVGLNF